MTENRQVMIASLPTGHLKPDDFDVRRGPVPVCGDGEVLCRTLALTIGAGQRAGLQGSASYAAAPVVGIVMVGTGVARVEVSNSPEFQEGDMVVAPTGWQEFSVHKPKVLRKVDSGIDPVVHLGIHGTNGLTAYFGLLDIGRPKKGETVVVSAAAGSVGHMVGQIARQQQCRVVGVAGSNEKCRLLVDELGFDAAVNYKSSDFRDAFKAATPDRIDVYFDNTGGDILESALFRMNAHGRIVCCGAVSLYDSGKPAFGPRGVPGLLVNNRVKMEGFLVFDYADRYEEARQAMTGWVERGELKPRVSEFHGLDEAPKAFVELLAGRTIGTTIVRLT